MRKSESNVVGLITVLLLAFFLEYREQVKRREQTYREQTYKEVK